MVKNKRNVKRIFQVLCCLPLIAIHSEGIAQVYAQNGMVVSSNAVAPEAGIAVLKKGGNAIDASIATALALAVTHPAAGNIGGGGFLVIMNANGEVTTIDLVDSINKCECLIVI